MTIFSFLPLTVLLWVQSPKDSKSAEAVLYKDTVYLSVAKLAEAVSGTAGITDRGRAVHLTADGKEWKFENGGDRIKLPSGASHMLKRPLLVLGGQHYLALEECATFFNYAVVKTPRLHFVLAENKFDLHPVVVESEYHRHRVGQLTPIHEVMVTKEPLKARTSLHTSSGERGGVSPPAPATLQHIPTGTTLLIRRKVTVDSVPCLVVTDCGPTLQSYIVDERQLREKTRTGDEKGTSWDRCRQWFELESAKGLGLRHGDRERLADRVCLTIDLCWSLRPYEAELIQSLKTVRDKANKRIRPVAFVSGRWLEQHPTEMHDLIRWSLEPNTALVWGLHSWDHPKSGGFMNDYDVPRLRADTLRLETALLEWGIVPGIYYRFPGLIHDEIRLRGILGLDLLPIDCDSWLALVRDKDAAPFRCRPQAGSIILVHGNGNEPEGIVAWKRWLAEHPNWEFAALNEFCMPSK